MKKKFGIGLVLSIATLASVTTASPASAGLGDCPDFGVACAFIDSNYRGKIVWQESSPGTYTYSGDFKKTSSIINRTAYTLKLIGRNDHLSLCIAAGRAVRQLPKANYADQLRTIVVKPSDGCTEWS